MFPATKNGRRCYIDISGKILLETNFIGTSFFYDGRSAVLVDNKVGFIDKKGNIVINPRFDEAGLFSEGLCAVKMEGKWGYIDIEGNIIIEPSYYAVGKFSEGIAGVQAVRSGDIMYIDKAKNIIIKDNGLPNIYYFSDGLLRCQDDKIGLDGYRNKDGVWHIKPQYALANSFSEGLAGVIKEEKKNAKTAFIDIGNNVVLPPKYETVLARFKDGLAVVIKKIKNDYKSGCIDKKGELVIPFQYNIIDDFSDGMAKVKIGENDKIGFIDKNGMLQIAPQFDSVWFPFMNGLSLVIKNNKKLYINKKGEIVWEFS